LTSRWYVLSCTPRKERVIFHQLRDRGFDVYYPYLILRTGDPNTLKIEPYFPGYLFVKVDLTEVALSTLQWMPMTDGLITIAGKPALVPDRIIRAIHRNLKSANSRILGMPEELDLSEAWAEEADASQENTLLLDQGASAGDRSRELLKILHGLSLTPEG